MKTRQTHPLQMIQRTTDNAEVPESIKWQTNSGNEELINHPQEV